MQRRPNFSISASVVVLLVVLAFVASFIKPHIPAPPPNPIAAFPGDFLEQAAPQQIDWHPMGPTAFAEARRLDRPVLMVIGVAWSQNGREFDSDVLQGPDVQNYLSRNYLCIRIDSGEMPAWATGFLPLNRATLGLRPRFQLWVLEPDGKMVANINRRRPESHLDQTQFLDELVRVRRAYTEMRQQNLTSDLEAQQRQDLAQIEAGGQAPTLDFSEISSSISGLADLKYGGFPQNGYQDLQPYAWEYLTLTGQSRYLHDSLIPALRSPIVDLLDGGFFIASRGVDWRSVEYDKVATRNAEMAWVLTQARPMLTNPEDRALCDYILSATITSLTGEFRTQSGFLAAARIGDEDDNGRSKRSSQSPSRLRDLLTSDERDWVREHLDLRIESNPQMIACLLDPAALIGFPPIREKLIQGMAPARFSNGMYMDVNGTVAARLLETGRALQNKQLVDFGSLLFDQLNGLRVGDEVPHDLEITARSPATLGDFLAFADAGLQDYLATGRVVSFQSGLAVLQRGLANFAGTVPGEFRMGLPPSSDLIPSQSANPQVVDDNGESASAKVVRLCTAYGRLLLGDSSETNPGVQLIRTAFATENLLAQPVSSVGLPAASFGCASLGLSDDEYALAVGPQAQQLADQLYVARPTRFVAPLFGPTRPDLSAKPAGIYVIRRGQALGPMTIAQAEDALSLTLNPGP